LQNHSKVYSNQQRADVLLSGLGKNEHFLVTLDALDAPAVYEDLEQWNETLERYERDWFKPLNKKPRAVHACGMNTQNQIKRTLSEPTSIDYICGLLESNEILHRSELATQVCEQFVFYDARGQAQRSGCLKALRELEAAGQFM